jgi:putative PEP-CTERM system TPR-repeat lipoprotein
MSWETNRAIMTRRILLSLFFLAVASCGSDDSVDDYLARAQKAMSSADYAAATIELKNALRLQPDSSQARLMLGKTYLAMRDMPSASKELQRALELGGTADSIKPALAEALLAQGEYKRVQDMDLSGLSAAALSRVLAMQAQAALAQGDNWNAEGLIDRALLATPESAQAILAKAQLQALKNDTEGASTTLDKLLTVAPTNEQGWSLRGDLLAGKQDFKGALAAYSKAVELQEKDYQSLFKRALMNLQLGEYDAAQSDANKLLFGTKNSPQANYIQGLLRYQAGKFADAITSLTAAEPIYQQYPLALFFLAGSNLKEGHFDLAASQAERFYGMVPESIQGRKLLASIRLKEGNFNAAQSLLQPILDSAPDDIDALNLMSNALLRAGRMDEAIPLLAKVAKLQPDSAGAQIRLGAGLLLGGKSDDAMQHMETALELDPKFQLADIMLVTNHLQKGDIPGAIAAAEAYKSRHPNEVMPNNLLGKVYLDSGERKKAVAAFEQSLILDNADPAANHYLAQIALKENNDIAAARKRYETALAGHPDSAPTLIQLALLDEKESNKTAMVAHLEQARKVDPTAVYPRLMLARFFLAEGKPDQVAPLFTDLDPQQQQSPDVLPLVAMAQLALRDYAAAKHTLEQLLKSAPETAAIRHAMAMAESGTGDEARAVDELRRAIALDENYVISRIALAKIALGRGDHEEFDKQLKKLGELGPQNPDVVLLQAAGAQNKGDSKEAIKLAEKAYTILPSTATLLALTSYETMNGNQQAAQQRYADWLQKNPDDSAVRMAYADNLLESAKEDQAVAQYSEVLKSDPKNVLALNNVAWLIRLTNPTQALEYSRQAASLDANSPEVLDTLAVNEYLNKDYRRAQRSIERALEKLPNNPSLVYHGAMIAAALDDKAGARATLEKLLAGKPEFPELAEANALLQKVSQ